jgi:hypothetical protein
MSEMTDRYDERHAKSGPAIYHDGFVFYPNGAYRENHPMRALLREPPTDPMKNAKLRLLYWQILKERAEKAFWDRKNYLKHQQVPTRTQLAELKKLQAAVMEARVPYDKVAKEIYDMEAPKRKDAEREAAFQASVASAGYLAHKTLDEINI